MKKRLNRWISSQAARPSGVFAPVVGWWLEHENRSLNRAVLRLLGEQQHQHVLEVGCGSGWALSQLASRGVTRLTAVDPSAAMVRRARRRSPPLRRLAGAGALDVRCAIAEALPFPDHAFDAAFGINVVYFFCPPLTALRELRRVLRVGGLLVLGAESPERLVQSQATDRNGFSLLAPSDVMTLCAAAGFRSVDLTRVDESGRYCVTAVTR